MSCYLRPFISIAEDADMRGYERFSYPLTLLIKSNRHAHETHTPMPQPAAEIRIRISLTDIS